LVLLEDFIFFCIFLNPFSSKKSIVLIGCAQCSTGNYRPMLIWLALQNYSSGFHCNFLSRWHGDFYLKAGFAHCSAGWLCMSIALLAGDALCSTGSQFSLLFWLNYVHCYISRHCALQFWLALGVALPAHCCTRWHCNMIIGLPSHAMLVGIVHCSTDWHCTLLF